MSLRRRQRQPSPRSPRRDDASDVYVIAQELLRHNSHRELLKFFTAERHSLDIDEVDTDGCSLLMHAARSGSPKCVQVLLEFGARVDHCDAHRNTPLHTAYACKHAQAAALLIRNGASETARNTLGLTPQEVTSADEFKVRLSSIELGIRSGNRFTVVEERCTSLLLEFSKLRVVACCCCCCCL